MTAATSHYTVTIEVTKTTRTPAQAGRYASDPPTPERRDVDKVANIVVRAPSLPELVRKVSAHVELLKPTPEEKEPLIP